MRDLSDAKIVSAQQLLIPILTKLKTREYRYSELRKAILKEFLFDNYYADVAAAAKAFAPYFDAACNHLFKVGYVIRPRKRCIAASPRCIEAMRNASWEDCLKIGAAKEPRMTWREIALNPKRALTKDAKSSVAVLLPKLPSFNLEQLRGIWRNATRALADPSKKLEHADISNLIDEIGMEWDRRAQLPQNPDDWFRWPGTDAPNGDGNLKLTGVPKEGMLSYLEYHVGRTNGEASLVRRSILPRIFENPLPPVFTKDYMDQWGQTKSPKRLRKMAETIAAFIRNFKRIDSDRYDDAITDWENDLQFLYDRYYVGHFAFVWPTTRVN